MTKRSSFDRSLLMKASSFSDDSATKCRDAADFDNPEPLAAGTSPSGKRTERPNLRVETLISIWFIAQLPSQSSLNAASQQASACSLPSKPRSRRRSIATLPQWKPILPVVLPQRCALLASLRACRGPQAACASRAIMSPRASSPAARHSFSKLADRLVSASIFNSLAGIAPEVINVFMAFLSFRGIITPSLQAQGGQRRSSYFNIDRDIPVRTGPIGTPSTSSESKPASRYRHEQPTWCFSV